MSWNELAACRGVHTSVFFPTAGDTYGYARSYCVRCPVRTACLEEALDNEAKVPYPRSGMYGGLTPEERSRLAFDRKVVA